MTSNASGALSSQTDYRPTEDTGKYVQSTGETGSYRMVNTAIGPESSHTEYRPTEDTGKYVQSTGGSDGYRMTNTASGALSSQTNYQPTEDTGKYAPSGNNQYKIYKFFNILKKKFIYIYPFNIDYFPKAHIYQYLQ